MTLKTDMLDSDLSNFKYILTQVEPEMRTEDQCLAVIHYLQSTEYLSKGNPIAFLELARTLVVRTYKEGNIVCKEGELGDEVYYILKGKVSGTSIIK